MSKIVMLKLRLQAPQIISDKLGNLLVTHPQLAKLLADQKNNQLFIDMIKELAIESLKLVAKAHSGEVVEEISGYYGQSVSSHDGNHIISAIKTNRLPRGLGLVIGKNGEISFVADDYGVQQEIKRLQEDFQTVFSAQATKTVLELLGYKTIMSEPQLLPEQGSGQKKVFVQVQGTRQ